MAGRRPPPRPARKPAAPAGAAHANGTVIAAFRRHWAVRTDEGVLVDCVLKGRSATIAAGDRVEIARFDDGGAILQVLPRRNLVYRSDAFKNKLIAANVTLVIGVVAPDLAVDLELVDRWSVAAEAEDCAFLLCANKADHPGFAAFLARLAPWQRLGYEVMPLSAKQDAGPLRARVLGEHSVLVGQSGMGKSTIVNALVPRAQARVGGVSLALGSGRHTTTESSLHLLPGDPAGGWIVDSPGMTKFALAHLDPDAIPEAFVELRPFLGHCRFRDCRHDQEPGCAVRQAIDRGDVAPHRVALMQAMVAESRAVRDPAR
jgi:ribosome biogenesis GTPase